MKKSNLIFGILCVIFGIACLSTALLFEISLEGFLWGFTGADIALGVGMIFRYFYWSLPKNAEIYAERLDNEDIEIHDELKCKIKDKTGRYAYSLGLAAISLSIAVFSILGTLQIIENARIIVLYLGGYLLFQIITAIIIFNKLMKKY